MPNQNISTIPEEAVAGLYMLGALILTNNEIRKFPNWAIGNDSVKYI